MSEHFYRNFIVGILGGGQLGRMLIQEAVNFNLDTAVLDPDTNAPCKSLCSEFTAGSLSDFDTVYNFGKNKDVVTIEFEHVNADALQRLHDEGVKVYPQPQVIRIVQDKGLQKQFYREHSIPTAPFVLVDSKADLEQHRSFFPCFQKLRRSGYDGRGVIRVDSADAVSNAFDAPSVLEKYIDFEKEIAVIVARNASGQVEHFPPVELEFSREANLVEYLFSPAQLTTRVQEEAIAIARKVAEKIGIVGILAVEMFLTRDGEVLVNEIAPRPHNSGHHTIEGNVTSQYQQHLRAILNLPLGDTSIKMPSVMVNLLGEKGFEGMAKYEGLEAALAIGGVNIHLYGKKTTKPFRKMGHVTVTDESLESARKKAVRVKELLKVTSGDGTR
jgi:5-(carboxyamino)imidazole ribonucleotide synthase